MYYHGVFAIVFLFFAQLLSPDGTKRRLKLTTSHSTTLEFDSEATRSLLQALKDGGWKVEDHAKVAEGP